ncbi:MAG: 3-hydroxybutyryl-CoA dehydrogenase [Flavobacteriaceae bacterium]|nr:3-hydroxybutyryl-CoA dehydrogenase [Flavobacteriaceae bacterium]
MKSIAVIGSGTMGTGIAQVFAQRHYKVVLIDSNEEALERSKRTIEKSLDIQISKELISLEDKESTLNHLILSSDLHFINSSTDLVIEAITERLEVKQDVFKQMDQLSGPHTILASNTSSISIHKLSEVTSDPSRVIGMHFMNPVPRMPLVEIIQSKSTDVSIVDQIVQLTNDLNKIPVVVNDHPGFVSNRILMPMINEAIECLRDGVATVDGIDQVMKLGMSHPMGPLFLADLIGLDVCKFILDVLYKELHKEKYKSHQLLDQLVSEGHLGRKTNRGFYDYTNPKNPKPISF